MRKFSPNRKKIGSLKQRLRKNCNARQALKTRSFKRLLHPAALLNGVQPKPPSRKEVQRRPAQPCVRQAAISQSPRLIRALGLFLPRSLKMSKSKTSMGTGYPTSGSITTRETRARSCVKKRPLNTTAPSMPGAILRMANWSGATSTAKVREDLILYFTMRKIRSPEKNVMNQARAGLVTARLIKTAGLLRSRKILEEKVRSTFGFIMIRTAPKKSLSKTKKI